MVTAQDLEIYRVEDFENLPVDGLWEVADGRAILLPGDEIDHQEIAAEIHARISAVLVARGHGRLLWTVNLDIPPYPGEGFRTRVPDLVIFENRPSGKRFGLGKRRRSRSKFLPREGAMSNGRRRSTIIPGPEWVNTGWWIRLNAVSKSTGWRETDTRCPKSQRNKLTQSRCPACGSTCAACSPDFSLQFPVGSRSIWSITIMSTRLFPDCSFRPS